MKSMREEKGTINVLVDAGGDDGNPMKSEKILIFFNFLLLSRSSKFVSL